MAVPVVQGTPTTFVDAVNATSRTITKPLLAVAGEWLILGVAMDGGAALTPPAEFTTIFETVLGGGAYFWVGKRLVDETEGLTFTIGSNSEAGSGICFRVSGCDGTDCVDILSSMDYISGAGGEYTCPEAWAECADSLVLHWGGCDDGSVVLTKPSGDTAIAGGDLGSNTAGTEIIVSRLDQATAGYTGFAFVDSSEAGEETIGLTLVLRSTSTPSSYPAQAVRRCWSISVPELTTALTYIKPFGTVDGDTLVLIQISDTTGILSNPGSAFTSIDDTSNTAIWAHALYRVASSEGASYVGSSTTSSSKSGAMCRVVNANASPLDEHSVATGTDAAPTGSTITPSVDNCLLFFAAAADDDDLTYNTGYPTGYTGIFSAPQQQGADCSFILAAITQTSLAATGSVAGALSATEEWIAFNFAIKPVGGAPPPGASRRADFMPFF